MSVFLALSCVSAADDNQTDQISVSDETLAADANPGTFTDLNNTINTASSNIIELDKDYKHDATADSNFTNRNGIAISKDNLIIDGKGHSIDGNQKATIFRIVGNNITLKNINFIKGYGYQGGAVSFENSENVNIIDCTFTNNYASYGAGIFFKKTNNAQILNSAFKSGSAGTNGGAIYFTASNNVEIKNSNFSSHTASNYGGAIAQHEGSKNLTIENSAFTQNTAQGYGGAIDMQNGYVKNCTFVKNTAISKINSGGAGVSISSGVVENCIFKENYGREGGGVRGTYEIINCEFIGNTATNNGAAVAGSGNIINSTFTPKTGNTMEAVYTQTYGTISNCTFNGTGVKYNPYSPGTYNLTIENSLFLNANIVNTKGYLALYNNVIKGGTIQNSGKTISKVYFMVPNYAQLPTDTLILAKFFDDNGNTIYGDILIQGCFNFVVEDENGVNQTFAPGQYTQINGNWYYKTSHNLDEGNYNVYINLTDKQTFEKYFSNYEITSGLLEVYDYNNFATLESDILNAQGSTITLTKDYVNSLTTESNYANGININRDNIVIDGAGHTISGSTVARIFNITGNNVILKNINFSNGFADCGGAVYANKNITVINCTFTDNRANRGGAIYLVDGTVIDSTFTGNHATVYGGAVYIENDGTIDNSTFISNSAENGGAVYFKTTGEIKDSTFNQNTAENGGAAYFDGNVNIIGSSFTSNSAENGGSAYFKNDCSIRDSTFDSNYASHGGAIFNEATLTITDSAFAGNTAADQSDNVAIIDNGKIIVNNVIPADLNAEIVVDLSYVITSPRYGIYYKDDITFDITVTTNNKPINTGTAIININNKNYTSSVINGFAQITIPGVLNGGRYIGYLTYDGGKRYSKTKIPVEFTIDPLYTQINPTPGNMVINVDERYMAALVCTQKYDQDGNYLGIPGEILYFFMDYNPNPIGYNITNQDGVAIYEFTADILRTLKAGSHTIYVYHNATENYRETSRSATFEIAKGTVTEITAEDATYTIDETPNYTVLIKDKNGRPVCYENVTFTMEGIDFVNATDENGIATFAIPYGFLKFIGLGEHSLTIKLDGTNYNVNNKRVTITVEKANAEIIAPNANFLMDVGGEYSVTVKDKSGSVAFAQVIFSLGRYDLGPATTDLEGVATISVPVGILESLGYGVHDLIVTFEDSNYNPANKTAKISINTLNAEITADNASFEVETDASYSATVIDSNGVPVIGEEVTFTLDGVELGTVMTDENGVATITIPSSAGNKNIGVKLTNDKYAAENKTANIVIEKGNTEIVAKAVSYVINYGGTYSVTLKNVNGKVLAGKQVTFILNGKNIGSAVTDANGVASIKLTAAALKTAKAGSKNLVIKFNGDSNYNPTSKTVKITIKKEKTKIAAKKKTFKVAKKTKKYTIALKNSKGKAIKKAKVYIKVGKKTYKAKTNSRGKATFKITKLTKKGKYTAKITFKANAYYLKAVKKVKITVK